METAHRGLASGTRRNVRARPTQGRVAPAEGNAELAGRPQDEGGLREAGPAGLHSLVGQVPKQRQGRDPKGPEGLNRHRHEGRSGGHLPIRAPLGSVPGSGRKPGGACSTHSKGCSRRVDDGNVTHYEPAWEHEHDIPLGLRSEGRVDTQRVWGADVGCMNIVFTERDGRKGPPAGNKAKCNCTNTPHSKATRRKAKPNQKPQTHTRGKRQA
jgi:hypothetical protein